MKAFDIEVHAFEADTGEKVVHLYQDREQMVIVLFPEQVELVIDWLRKAKDECAEAGDDK